MELEHVRDGFLGLLGLLVLLAVWQYKRTWRALRLFWTEPQPALNLGILRVVIGASLLRGVLGAHASWWAHLPAQYRNVRPGWEPFADYIPVLLPWTAFGEKVLTVASLFALLGVFSRTSCFVAGVFGVLVFAVQQMFFKITHGLNLPVLTALILAVSPSGDALSVDALVRRMRGIARPGPSVAYALPLRFAWLLLGASYLFPGIAKLWESGDLWIDGTRMHVALFEKWSQLPEYTPNFRPDAYPWMLVIFGVGTLVFEIFFTPALFFRSTRRLAGLTACVFHLCVGITMSIWFDFVYPLIVFIDFRKRSDASATPGKRGALGRAADELIRLSVRLDARLSEVGQRLGLCRKRPAPRRAWIGSLLVGGALTYGMFWAGANRFNSWPISIYPKFSSRTTQPRLTGQALTFAARRPDGTERPLVNSFYPIEDSASIYQFLRDLRDQDEEAKDDAYRFLARVVLGNNPPLESGEQVVVRQFEFFAEPERRKGDKLIYHELAVFRPPPPEWGPP